MEARLYWQQWFMGFLDCAQWYAIEYLASMM